MNRMTRWGAGWLVLCGLTLSCTEDVKFQAASAEQSGLVVTEYFNAEDLVLRLAPTEEVWIADPVDDTAVINNFKGNLLRGEKAVRLRVEGSWGEFRRKDGVTGWAELAKWEPADTWFAGTNAKQATLCFDLGCGQNEVLPSLTLVLVNGKAVNGMNPVRFDDKKGYVKSEDLALDDEAVFFAFQVVRAEWSLINSNMENNGRILDKARIKYPSSPYLDTLSERIPFADFSQIPYIDTSDREAIEMMRAKVKDSVSGK